MSGRFLTAVLAIMALTGAHAFGAPFTVSYTDGGTWNTIYTQGFSPALAPNPNPGVGLASTVYMNQFQFFKSGNADSASSIQLAIFNTMYPFLTGITTSSPEFVGLSTNTVANTSSISTGSPITFTFNNLPLTYGSDYSAVYLNVGGGGALTPVLVSSLTANYVDVGGGDYHPQTNYGTESQFQYVTSNFISGGYFSAFSYAGDANFVASLDSTVPEPGSFAFICGLAVMRLMRRPRSR